MCGRKRTRSLLCLPIFRQTKLIGALYLENNLTPGAFTPERLAVLEMLASQAAISLENAPSILTCTVARLSWLKGRA